MNWYSVLVAAVSGALAGAVASLIFSKQAHKGIDHKLVMLILFLVFNVAGKQLVLPRLGLGESREDIESELEKVPAFASIKKYEPKTYQDMVAALTDAGKKNLTQQQKMDLVKAQVASLVEARIPHASDAAIVAYVKVMVSEMGELQARADGSCYKFLFPQKGGGIDPGKVFSEQVQRDDLAALDELIKTSNTRRALPDASEALPNLKPVLLSLHSSYGDDMAIIDHPSAPNVDREKVCRIMKDLYGEIGHLRREDAALTLRWMFGQHGA